MDRHLVVCGVGRSSGRVGRSSSRVGRSNCVEVPLAFFDISGKQRQKIDAICGCLVPSITIVPSGGSGVAGSRSRTGGGGGVVDWRVSRKSKIWFLTRACADEN